MRSLAICCKHIPSKIIWSQTKHAPDTAPTTTQQSKPRAANPRVLQRTERLLEEGPAAVGVALKIAGYPKRSPRPRPSDQPLAFPTVAMATTMTKAMRIAMAIAMTVAKARAVERPGRSSLQPVDQNALLGTRPGQTGAVPGYGVRNPGADPPHSRARPG